MTVLDRLEPGSRVAVLRLRSLGDSVLTTPALELLKQFRPDLRIAVAVEDRFAPVFTGNPAIDTILAPKMAALAQWRPALTINLHGGTKSLGLTLASRARWRAGFAHFRFRAIYNVRIPRAQEILGIERTVHTAEHLASAMFYLGVPQRPIPRARLYASEGGLDRRAPYAVLHPKASSPAKTWPAQRFLEAARYLKSELGIEPVFIAGPGEGLEEFAGFTRLAGQSLEQLKQLLESALLFVGNDSGPAHMAAALGRPSVVLFGESDPLIWGPWKTEARVLTHPQGIGAIDTAQVCDALSHLCAGQTQ